MVYILSIIFLFFSAFLYKLIAFRHNIIDKPNYRSSHTKPTIRGGGIIFTLSILLFFIVNDFEYPYFCIGVLLISIVSFLDDIYTLSAKIRFPFQIFSVFLTLLEVGLPFQPIYIFIIVLVVCIAVVNFFNFMDGINGLTGMYGLATILGFYFINLQEEVVNSDLLIYTFISLLIFGFYNFRKKALFFAGDIGSITLGMLVVFLGVYFIISLKSPVILLLIFFYGGDAILTLLYRKLFTKEIVFEPHRHHLYQKLVDIKKVPHIKVAIGYALLQTLINVLVYYTYSIDFSIQLLILFILILIFIGMYVFLFNYLKRITV
ncbi:MraY family glycosyltransferase [Polaribacter gochangensis]|uniref:MraY family glycosyltransferase n=1 Tax=Polaribacter gochangensis TaxID=3252903 RepID=UPI0039047819